MTLPKSRFLKKCCLALPRLTFPPPPLTLLATMLSAGTHCCNLFQISRDNHRNTSLATLHNRYELVKLVSCQQDNPKARSQPDGS